VSHSDVEQGRVDHPAAADGGDRRDGEIVVHAGRRGDAVVLGAGEHTDAQSGADDELCAGVGDLIDLVGDQDRPRTDLKVREAGCQGSNRVGAGGCAG